MTRLIIMMAITLGFAQSLSAETKVIKAQYECIGTGFNGTLDFEYTPHKLSDIIFDVTGEMILSGYTVRKGVKEKSTWKADIKAADKAAFLAISSVFANQGSFQYLVYRFDYKSSRLVMSHQLFDLIRRDTISGESEIYNCAEIKQP